MAKPQAKTVIRSIRQEELRNKLAAGGHLQQVIKNIDKINNLNVDEKTFKNSLEKLRATTDYQLKLINKYLPDLKSTELTGEGGGALIAKSFNDMYE
jgi:hypothetical protein